jgi:hypothetical protein
MEVHLAPFRLFLISKEKIMDMKAEVFRIATFGILAVYERKFYKPKYFVLRTPDQHILEEFKMKKSALKWADQNQGG